MTDHEIFALGDFTLQRGGALPVGIERLAPITGSSHTSPPNQVFLEGLRAALTADSAFADGDYADQPHAGLRAFSRVYAGWGLSQAFCWDRVFERLGFATLEDFIVGVWEPNFTDRDGDTHAALASVKARALVMLPTRTSTSRPKTKDGASSTSRIRPRPTAGG